MIVVVAIAEARAARRAAVDAIVVKSVAAVIERRASAPRVSERALKARLSRLTALERMGLTILPVRFGTTVASPRELRALIAPQAEVLARALAHVRGRRQMTVRVRGEAARPSRASGARYIAGLAKAARLTDADPIRLAVEPFVIDERVDTASRAGFSGALHHLVAASDVEAYQDAVASVQRKRPRRFVATGPTLPFAFVPAVEAAEAVGRG